MSARNAILALLILTFVFAVACDPIEELAESLVEALTAPRSSRPRTTRPRPRTQRPRTQRPRSTRPRSTRPRSTRPRSTRPRTQRPRSTRPRTQKPKSQKPRSQRPKSQKPKSQKPKSQKPKSQKPKSDKPKSQKPVASSKPTPSGKGSPAEKSLQQIFKHEGKCQNWKNDSGNKFNGQIGYTCMGIIPKVGYDNRNGAFSYAADCAKGNAANFVKCAYDKDPAKFREAASDVYKNKYFKPGGCDKLAMPAYYVCGDIAVNSGVGRSQQYLKAIGNVSDPKELARKLNEMHRKDYIKWSAPGTKNAKFRQGWLSRADSRSQYINNYSE